MSDLYRISLQRWDAAAEMWETTEIIDGASPLVQHGHRVSAVHLRTLPSQFDDEITEQLASSALSAWFRLGKDPSKIRRLVLALFHLEAHGQSEAADKLMSDVVNQIYGRAMQPARASEAAK